MEPRPRADDLRTIRMIWIAIIGGVSLMTVAFVGMTMLGIGRSMEDQGALLFYGNAAVNIVAVLAAFTTQRRMMDRLPNLGTYEQVVSAVRLAGIMSLAIMEGSALVAGLCAILSGQGVNLLFILPFFGFAALFFPTESRFASLLGLAGRR